MIDLNPPAAVEAAAAWRAKFGGRVTGFASHVAESTLLQARAAGIDRVMSNGAFTAHLEQIMQEIAQAAESPRIEAIE